MPVAASVIAPRLDMKRKLNVLFIPTANSSIMAWRMQSFVESAHRLGVANFVNPLWMKDLDTPQPWERKMPNSPEYDPMFTRAFVPAIESGCVKADAIVFQYVHEEGALDLFDSIKIRFPHVPILTEIDDNLLSVPPYNEAFEAYSPRSEVRRRALEQIKNSDGVIASTPYLKEVYSEYNPNIWVVENSVDFRAWDKLKRKARPGIRIGWAGGSGHEGDVASVQDAIINTCAKHKDVKFVFINGPSKTGLPEYFKGIPQIQHKAVWVPIGKYPNMLADLDFDIGIAPLVDSAFNRGKSNLKWLENAALGIPTVASNVGHYAETLKSGRDCILADDQNEFELALDVLISDRKRRVTMGRTANERARQDFNVDKKVLVYLAALKEAIAVKSKEPVMEAA